MQEIPPNMCEVMPPACIPVVRQGICKSPLHAGEPLSQMPLPIGRDPEIQACAKFVGNGKQAIDSKPL